MAGGPNPSRSSNAPPATRDNTANTQGRGRETGSDGARAPLTVNGAGPTDHHHRCATGAGATVAREHSPAEADRPWTAWLTAPGGEALLLKGAVTLVRPLPDTLACRGPYTQLWSVPPSENWTEINGIGPGPRNAEE